MVGPVPCIAAYPQSAEDPGRHETAARAARARVSITTTMVTAGLRDGRKPANDALFQSRIAAVDRFRRRSVFPATV
jgi:hypothetical protein